MSGGFEPGQRFGDFEIIEVAGEGGMGVVYRARQITLERIVALKVISPHVADAPDFTDRFRRESRLAASIDHPHVVSVHSAGELEGRAYIAMQWVDGTGLERLLAGGRPLEEARMRRIISQLAGALDTSHAKELVHRDVKPPNVLVRSISGTDHAYLTDFGIARRVDVGATGLTRTGQTVGTVGYMAPEQIRGERSDGRADLYSLGCVLYQCLTGRRPFEHDSEVAVMFAHVNEERPRPSTVRPELARFDDVVSRALALEPEDRFQTGAELAEALGRAGAAPATAAGATVASVSPPAGRTRTGVTDPLPDEPDAPPPPPPPRRPAEAAEPAPAPERRPDTAKRVLIGLGVLLLVAAIAFGAFAAAGGLDSGGSTTVISDAGDTTDSGGGNGGGGAGGGGGGGAAPETGAERTAVVRVLEEYASEYSAQDAAGIGALLTADVARVGASASGCRQTGIDEVVAAYESQFALGTGVYTLGELSADDVDVRGDIATVTTSYSISTGGSGSISFALERAGDEWLIADIQAPCVD